MGTKETLNTLSDSEKTQGWILLFDGKSFAGWRGLGREIIPKGHWKIENGAIKKIPSAEVPLQDDGQPLQGGDLLSVDTFMDFELSFEWKISAGGNSGIKYNVSEGMSTANPPRHAALGFEYQILDDDRHADALVSVTHQAGALYDLLAAEKTILKPVGEYNTARIIFQNLHGEHWLNGRKILEFDLDSEDMQQRLQKSKYRNYESFGDKRKGHIVLQDHTDAAWFRNLKLRKLKGEGTS
ncbi:MAG: DUF1080 domain-containing protein [Candidatus Aminicenantes bacterium]|nr:DUF1080 domain-containing protein [Candidatus Aminicenantes bacterium]